MSNKPHPSDSLRCPISIDKKDSRYNESLTVEGMLSHLEGTELHGGVDKDVAIHFETTRNLYLYSFYNYRFGMVAEMHAYASIELALKEQLPSHRIKVKRDDGRDKNLDTLLTQAFKEGVLQPNLFHDYSRLTQNMTEEAPKDKKYIENFKKRLTDSRNRQMHGSTSLLPPWVYGLHVIKTASDLINQLYTRGLPNEEDI